MKNRIFRAFSSLFLSFLLVSSLVPQVYTDAPAAHSTPQDASVPLVTKKVAYVETPGFSQQHENGSYSGVIIDYLTEIAKYSGWQYEYVALNADELTDALLDGSVDLIGGAHYSDDLAQIQAYPDLSSGCSRISLLARWEDESIANKDAGSLEGKTIGVSALASQAHEYLEAFLNMHHVCANIRVFSMDEYVDGSLDFYLEAGEVDVLVGRAAENSGKFRTIDYIDTQPYYIVCRKDDNDTLNKLNFALRQINLSNPNFGESVTAKNFPHLQNLKFYLTEEEKAYIAEKKTIRVLIPRELYPMSIMEGDAAPTGITPDFLDRIAKLTGLQIEYIPLEASDAYPAMVAEIFRQTHADVVGCAVENGGVFNGIGLSTSVPYMPLARTFIRNKNVDFRAEGLTVAALNRQRAPSGIKPKETLFFDTLPEVLAAVNSGKADLGFSSAANIQYMQQFDFYPNITTVTTELEDVNYCFATDTFADAQLLTILNKAINSMSEEEILQIRESHLKLPARANLGLIRELLYNNAFKVTAVVLVFVSLVIAGIYSIFNEKVKREKAALQLADAQSANKAKSVFLSHISHDIRTPINGITGMTHIAMQNLDNPMLLKRSLEKISRASAQLETLVNEVLEMSRIESGKMTLVEAPFDLLTLQENIDSVISSMISHSNTDYSYTSTVAHTHLIGSSVYIQRVMVNILTNAIKYTPAGGRVRAALEEKELDETQGMFTFTVADNGIGMSKEFLEHIFESFSREHPDAGTTYTGTGLGMSITKELVDLMHGSIQITSEPNQGTTVVIQLPLKYDFSKPQSDPDSETSLAGLHILVVEDNALNGEIALYILQEHGANAILAENGQKAVDLFQSKPAGYYDVILMDLMMPVMDGFAATKAIRRCDKADSQSIPILATTANAFAEDLQMCLKCGMNDHIAKPLNINELLSKIRQHCKKNTQ